MEHPFSVRSWQRQDFAAMFRLLHLLGCNAVMIWPTPETALIQFPRQIVRKAEEIRWAQIFWGETWLGCHHCNNHQTPSSVSWRVAASAQPRLAAGEAGDG